MDVANTLYWIRGEQKKQDVYRLAKVVPEYLSGRPKVIFDGEEEEGGREYPHLDSYSPAAGDRVILMRAGRTWVILGKIV